MSRMHWGQPFEGPLPRSAEMSLRFPWFYGNREACYRLDCGFQPVVACSGCGHTSCQGGDDIGQCNSCMAILCCSKIAREFQGPNDLNPSSYHHEPGCLAKHRCSESGHVHRKICHVPGCGATCQLVSAYDCEGCGRMQCSAGNQCPSSCESANCCARELCGLCTCKIGRPPDYLVTHNGRPEDDRIRLVGSIKAKRKAQLMCQPCLLGPPFRHAVDALERNAEVAPNVEKICKRQFRRALSD